MLHGRHKKGKMDDKAHSGMPGGREMMPPAKRPAPKSGKKGKK